MNRSQGDLRWRCRRGMLELDVLLNRFLDCREEMSAEEEDQFRRLLDHEDDTLWDWLSGREMPREQGLVQIIQRIRGTGSP